MCSTRSASTCQFLQPCHAVFGFGTISEPIEVSYLISVRGIVDILYLEKEFFHRIALARLPELDLLVFSLVLDSVSIEQQVQLVWAQKSPNIQPDLLPSPMHKVRSVESFPQISLILYSLMIHLLVYREANELSCSRSSKPILLVKLTGDPEGLIDFG